METVKMNRIRLGMGLILVLTTTLLAGSVASAPTWGGSLAEEDGWPTVLNPATPIAPEQVIQPAQQWRIGADEDDMIFGLIEDALVDPEGSVYLLDTVLNTVYVMGPGGEVLRNLGGDGDGPGEFRFARKIVFLPEGTLGIMEMMPGKIVVVGRDGTPHSSFALLDNGQGMMHQMNHIATNNETVVLGRTVTDFQAGSVSSHFTLSSFAGDGSLLATLLENKVEQSGGSVNLSSDDGESSFTRNFTLCQDGRVVVYQHPHEYKLDIYDTRGRQKQIIRREYESVRRSDEDLEDARKQSDELRERFGGSVEMVIEEFANDISKVIARPNGELWVANSQGDRDCPENSIGIFDVFDQDGRYTHRVRIEADFDPEHDLFKLCDNHLFVFKEAQNAPDRTQTIGGEGGGMMIMMLASGGNEEEDEDEEIRPYEVICYRLTR